MKHFVFILISILLMSCKAFEQPDFTKMTPDQRLAHLQQQQYNAMRANQIIEAIDDYKRITAPPPPPPTPIVTNCHQAGTLYQCMTF